MIKKKDKVLHKSKPTFWYYLLAIFFPIMFFLIDDSSQLFDTWDASIKTYIINSLALFTFFGVPVLMYILRREIIIYRDKVEIYKPTIKTLKTYYFTDLVKWDVTDIYIPKAGRQINLILKFKNKKLTFNKIELTGFTVLIKVLEEYYLDKKSN